MTTDPNDLRRLYEEAETREIRQRELEIQVAKTTTANPVGRSPRGSRRFIYGLDVSRISSVPFPSADDPEFLWGLEYLFDGGAPVRPAQSVLHANPTTTTPLSGFTYPLASSFVCNSALDRRFASGYFYSSSTEVSKKLVHRERLLRTSNPPGVVPVDFVDGRQVMQPIEGMIQMPPGCPFVTFIDGDPARLMTVACFHTLSSLARHRDGKDISRLSDDLWEWSFGTETRMPLFKLGGLKPNYRSKAVALGSGDGSYSIATTLGEGQGKGVVQPAVQANGEDAKAALLGTLQCIHGLYRKIAPLCMSKLEWDVINFRDNDLNVFTLGGLNPGPSSCQMNISSAWFGGSLISFLGILQGQWHVDKKDDIVRWTLLIVQIRIPPGSDPGAFMQARSGLYAWAEVSDDGQVRWFLLFKGNDLHSGTAPTVDASVKTAFLNELSDHYLHVGEENRVVFVAYPNSGASSRNVKAVAVTEVLGFGNDGGDSAKDAKMYAHTFVEDGRPALGDHDAWANRLGREAYMLHYNFFRCMDFEVDRTLPVYTNGTGDRVHIDALPFDPETDAEWVDRMRGLYLHMAQTSRMYAIDMTKEDFKSAQLRAVAAYNKERSTGSAGENGDDAPRDNEQTTFIAAALTKGTPVERDDDDDFVPESEEETSIKKGAVSCGETQGISSSTGRIEDGVNLVGGSATPARVSLSGAVPQGGGTTDAAARGGNARHTSGTGAPSSPSTSISTDVDYAPLCRLLDVDRVDTERAEISTAFVTVPDILHAPSSAQARDMIREFRGINALYEAVQGTGFDSQVAFDFVSQLDRASKTIADTDVAKFKLVVLQACNRIGACRGLLYVYQWYTIFGPALASAIFDVYKNEGEFVMFGAYPQFAELAYAIMDWITTAFATGRASSTPNDDTRHIDAAAPALCLPADLFGLLQTPKSSRAIIFPLPLHRYFRTYDKRYALARRCFLEIISEFVIIHGIREVDKRFNSSRRSDSMLLVKARSVVRGAVLDCITQCLGDDCVFASSALDDLLRSPTALFHPGAKEDGLSKQILANPADATARLSAYLREHWNMGVVNKSFHGLHSDLVESLARFSVEPPVIPKKRTAQPKKNRIAVVIERGVELAPDVPLSDICPYERHPMVAMMAIMLRETIARAKGLPSVNRDFARILDGKNPYTSARLRFGDNIDQFNPIRRTNLFQTYLERSLDLNHKITSKYGLSNLLVRIGTGQGTLTSDFLAAHLKQTWFTTSEQCVTVFRQGWAAGLVIDNLQIWGQPAVALRIPRNSESVPQYEERFDPMFTDHIYALWSRFLRGLIDIDPDPEPTNSSDSDSSTSSDDQASDAPPAKKRRVDPWDDIPLAGAGFMNKDPATYAGVKPTYNHALKLSELLKVNGFGSGITRMQLANTLALLGVCSLPSIEDMADVVSAQPKKGAGEGLRLLGFNVPDEVKAIDKANTAYRKALLALYDILDYGLSQDHKQVLGFGAMFVEHSLCKLVRWGRALENGRTLQEVAQAAIDFDGVLSPAERYPIPLTVDREQLSGWMAVSKLRI